MKTELLFIFGVLSFLIRNVFLGVAIWQSKKGERAKLVLAPVQVYTIGVFLSVVCLFVPVYYTNYYLGDDYAYIRPFLLSVHNALRVFILDGEFDIIKKALCGQPLVMRVLFSLHAAFLYVIAPVLTFGNVLSLFKNLRNEIRYRWHRIRPHYIMSELNAKSVALAKSIRDSDEGKKAVIVFTDVFEQNEEDDYELLMEVREMNAICLKKDIAHIDIMFKKGDVELFLIGEDESENVSQAVRITTELNKRNAELTRDKKAEKAKKKAEKAEDKKAEEAEDIEAEETQTVEAVEAEEKEPGDKKAEEARKKRIEKLEKKGKYNVKVFVFSQNASSAYVLDSIQYENLLDQAARHGYSEDCFKLRRISERQQLIWNSVPEMRLFKVAQRYENRLSVLIVGFGSYGSEFFKTLLWYCQFEGYRLQITVVDQQESAEGKKSPVQSMIDRMCPELQSTNCSEILGEAYYDIEVIPGIDAQTADLDDLLRYSGDDERIQRLSERLRATNVAMVALGNDDRNIEVAVHLRSLFDQLHGVKGTSSTKWLDEMVDIYAVVYDDQKSGILARESDEDVHHNALINHKGVPYHVHFIGGMSSQFKYSNIYWKKMEEAGFAHHIGWVEIERRIYEELGLPDEERYQPDMALEVRRYEQHEYYRLSSIAKYMYQTEIEGNNILRGLTTCIDGRKQQTCTCDGCIRRKRSEHMRWNAYTRTLGYMYAKRRADRAKLHDNLCGWNELGDLEKLKD